MIVVNLMVISVNSNVILVISVNRLKYYLFIYLFIFVMRADKVSIAVPWSDLFTMCCDNL